MKGLNIVNFNAYRTKNKVKIKGFRDFFDGYDPMVICIQEINIVAAMQEFKDRYNVLVNIAQDARDGIGIITLIKRGVVIEDLILGSSGRILGVKLENIQIWNVYPKSGSAFKRDREIFFREELTELMMQWKDSTRYIFQSGDHNCIYRKEDSLHNSSQHLQPGLVNHLQVHGLSDDFTKVHGEDFIMFSRVTDISRTRIDYIFSNSNSCLYFQYVPVIGLDHYAAVARYDLEMKIKKEVIPPRNFFKGWVMSKSLEMDDHFIEQAEFIIKNIHEEYETGIYDASFYWLKLKTALINLAKTREKELHSLS